MTEEWVCPSCHRTFTSLRSYQNHHCSSGTLGGSGDVYSGGYREGIEKTEGGTGER